MVGPVELFGLVGAAFVVVALTRPSLVRQRALLLTGAVIFVVYSAIIGSLPVLVVNVTIVAVNIWFLQRELGSQRQLGAVPIAIDAPFLLDFIEFHREDIIAAQPEFTGLNPQAQAWMLTREGLPAGVFVSRRNGGDLLVDLDYVVAPYRDSQIGRWLYGKGIARLRHEGVQRVLMPASTKIHRDYLLGLGFTERAGLFRKVLI